MKKNCKNCFFAKSMKGKCYCIKGGWGLKEYALFQVANNRVPILLELPLKCPDWSPPEVMQFELYEKGDVNRKKINRILSAIVDGRKFWDYGELPRYEKSYWEEWE